MIASATSLGVDDLISLVPTCWQNWWGDLSIVGTKCKRMSRIVAPGNRLITTRCPTVLASFIAWTFFIMQSPTMTVVRSLGVYCLRRAMSLESFFQLVIDALSFCFCALSCYHFLSPKGFLIMQILLLDIFISTISIFTSFALISLFKGFRAVIKLLLSSWTDFASRFKES